MKRNEGTIDRAIRAGVSVTALGTGLAVGGPFNPVGAGLLVVGTVAGATAATGYCPLYSVLGISTCATDVEAAGTPEAASAPAA